MPEMILRWGATVGGEGGSRVRGELNTRWQREDLETMAANKTWGGGGERGGDGVRAALLAQKAIYEESHSWRHPLARLAAIWGGWRRRLLRH
jgi:hypothetical protein